MWQVDVLLDWTLWMNCTQQGGINDCCQDICFLACKEKTATSFIGFPEYHCANNLRRLPMQPAFRRCISKHVVFYLDHEFNGDADLIQQQKHTRQQAVNCVPIRRKSLSLL